MYFTYKIHRFNLHFLSLLYMALNNNEPKQNLYTLKCKKNIPSITHLKIEK